MFTDIQRYSFRPKRKNDLQNIWYYSQLYECATEAHLSFHRPQPPSTFALKTRFYAQLYRQHIHRASHSGGAGCGGVLAEDERGVQGRTRGGAGVDQRPDAVCALGRGQPNAV